MLVKKADVYKTLEELVPLQVNVQAVASREVRRVPRRRGGSMLAAARISGVQSVRQAGRQVQTAMGERSNALGSISAHQLMRLLNESPKRGGCGVKWFGEPVSR